MSSSKAHLNTAPWSKAGLIPLWVLTLSCTVFALFAGSLSTAISDEYHHYWNYLNASTTNPELMSDLRYKQDYDDEWAGALATGITVLVLAGLELASCITQIVLFSRGRLAPRLSVLLSALSAVAWAACVSCVASLTPISVGFWSAIASAALFLCALATLTYALVVRSRARRYSPASKSGFPADDDDDETAIELSHAPRQSSERHLAPSTASEQPLRDPSPASLGPKDPVPAYDFTDGRDFTDNCAKAGKRI